VPSVSTRRKEIAMMTTFRVIALFLITTFLLGGPFAPFARAQAPQPAPVPVPGGDLFQESVKATPGGEMPPQRGYSAFYDVGAVFANVLRLPTKIALCALGIGAGTALMGITFGTSRHAAVAAGEEGCGGKWILTGADLVPGPSTSHAIDWEQDASR
jgi:hypothetical protein